MNHRIFFLLLLVVVFSGCQSFQSDAQPPKVSINSVDIAAIGFNGVDLVVNVQLENPNASPIPMPEIDWELFIEDAFFIQGSLPGDKSIGRHRTVTLALPVSFSFEKLYNSFASLGGAKEAAYHIALAVSSPVSEAGGPDTLEYSGILPLPQFPVLSIAPMQIEKAGFLGMTLAWELTVENPNAFPIPFPKLNWEYDVNGVPAAQGSFSGSDKIAAGASGNAHIRVNLAYADILDAAGSPLNTAEATGNFSGGIDFEEIGFTWAGVPSWDDPQNRLQISGTIPILQMPKISFQGISRVSLGLLRLEFALVWELENRNSFGFEIDEFNYEVLVNNNQWAKGSMANPPRIAANSKTAIPVNVVITTPALVEPLVTILSRGSAVNYVSTGHLSLLPDLPGLEKLEIPLNFT